MSKPISGRDAEMVAIHLLTHPAEIGEYWRDKRWAELASLADYLATDVPRRLAQTDPALYRTLRKAVTEAYVMGFGRMKASVLHAMAKASSANKKNVKIPARP